MSKEHDLCLRPPDPNSGFHYCQCEGACPCHNALSDEIKIPLSVAAMADQYRHEFGDDVGDQVLVRWMREECAKVADRSTAAVIRRIGAWR